MSELQEWTTPAGWVAQPISAAAEGRSSGLSVCLLVRDGSAEDGAPRLMDLRDEADARVLLGCLTDASGTVHAWLRIASQDAARLVRTLRAGASSLNNRLIDERWARSCAAMGEVAPGELIRTGHEDAPAAPMALTGDGRLEVLALEGAGLSLCTDDAVLRAAGLGEYGATLHRYLWTGAGESPRFVAMSDGAPMGEGCVGVEEVLGDRSLVLAGGRLRVTRLGSLEYEAFADALGGAPAPGIRSGRTALGLTGLWGEPGGAGGHAGGGDTGAEGEDEASSGWLFQTRRGKWGRLIEMLHLKLRLFADAIDAVESATRLARRPMLNVEPSLFSVGLAGPGAALPRLWSARVSLTGAGGAVELPMAEADERVFVLAHDSADAGGGGPTVYLPDGGLATRGRGDLRLREIVTEDATPGHDVGELIVEGTFVTGEAVDPSPNDLLAVHASLGERSMTLRGRLEEDASLAAGEWRFRSLRTPMGSADRGAVRSACGAPLRGVRFELLPRLTSPRDLYGLMVLGVRTLLVDRDTTLAKAVDELLSLARQVGVEHEESVPLSERIQAIFERDERWMLSLGPQRLSVDTVEARSALDLVPRALWYDTLGLLVRMAPGWGPDSFVADLGDASPAAPHLIYEPVRGAMRSLLLRSRSP
ncbi:MAG: hypothetical protein AAGK04_11510, partial [Planctomycetota bacterium]